MQHANLAIAAPMGQRMPNPFELKLMALVLADMTRSDYLNARWISAQRSGAVIEVSPDGHARIVRPEVRCAQ